MMGYATIQPRMPVRTVEDEKIRQDALQHIHEWSATQPPRKVPMAGIQQSPVYFGG
jgi:hypothetical protein